MRMYVCLALLLTLGATAGQATSPKKKGRLGEGASPLDLYLQEIDSRGEVSRSQQSAGSIYSTGSRLGDVFRDLRASQLDDLVTILVSDRASAVSTGSTNTARKSSVNAGVQSIAGPLRAGGVLPNLVGATNNQQLQGQGTTNRNSTLTTNLSARVIRVLPNGNLVVEGVKEILVNSEKQLVSVRGILRPQDLSAANTIASDRLANLEVKVNGKGVVNDSIRRPFFLYRLLMSLLPI